MKVRELSAKILGEERASAVIRLKREEKLIADIDAELEDRKSTPFEPVKIKKEEPTES